MSAVPEAVARALAFIRDPEPGRFEETALAVFRYQASAGAPYRRFCAARGVDPETAAGWEDAPPVPTAAFKTVELTTAPPRRVFMTSGTTRGAAGRGRHLLPGLSLYEASWGEPFRRHLLPDRERMRILSVIPPGEILPESSLSFMADRILERFGAPGSGTYLDRRGLRFEPLAAALEGAEEAGEPVMLLGTALGMMHLLEDLVGAERLRRLPPGSRIMDTGGFKGRSRELSRGELLRLYRDGLGVPDTHVVGEYGMTELCSQFYETVLADSVRGAPAREPRVYAPPPWVRVRALDPDTLAPLPPGRTGLLSFFDLANAWTVSAVVTEDLGETVEGGFRLHGRARGAELRGCSLATEALLGD